MRASVIEPIGTPSVCQTTKNAWQAIDLASNKRDIIGVNSPPNTNH